MGVISLLNVLDFWMTNHGLSAIKNLKKEKKERMFLKQDRDSFAAKFDDATQKMQNMQVLQQQIVQLREELKHKTRAHEKKTDKLISQQRKINELQEMIDSQKVKISEMNDQINSEKMKSSEMVQSDQEKQSDQEWKNEKSKLIEMKDTNKRHKEIERKLKTVYLEKEKLFKEKELIQHKLKDFEKVRDELSLKKANEIEFEAQIKNLRESNMKLKDENKVILQLMEQEDAKTDASTFISSKDKVHSYNIEGRRERSLETKNKARRSLFGYKSALIGTLGIAGVLTLVYFILKYRKLQNSLNAKDRVIQTKYKSLDQWKNSGYVKNYGGYKEI